MIIKDPPFINRQSELALFRKKAVDIIHGRGEDLFLIAPAGRGKTALLKELKDQLFWQEQDLIPVYFDCSREVTDILALADAYLTALLSQILLFEKKDLIVDPKNSSLSFRELQQEAEKQGKAVMEEVIFKHQRACRTGDENKGLLNALEAPGRIAQALNKPVWMVLDHFQEIETLSSGGKGIIRLWRQVIGSPWAPHLFCGEPPGFLLKTLFPALRSPQMTVMELTPLPEEEGPGLGTVLGTYFNVETARDLMPIWFNYLEGNPGTLTSLFREASAGAGRLESHTRFCRIYLESLARGELGRGFEHRLLAGTAGDPFEGGAMLRILHHLETSKGPMLAMTELSGRLDFPPERILPTVARLERAGLIWERFGNIGLENGRVLRDWIKVQVRRYLFQENPAQIIDDLGSELERVLSGFDQETTGHDSINEKCLHFSLVLPINSESELVAVRALEQIATYSELDENSIEKAKIALIEACINAGEHSQSFEKKIRVYFEVQPEALEIVVEDRGQSFDPVAVQARMVREKAPLAQKRGRGLGFIREMMDEVRFEKADMGTRLVMIKKKNNQKA